MHGIHANIKNQHEEKGVKYGCYASKRFLETREPDDAMVGLKNVE